MIGITSTELAPHIVVISDVVRYPGIGLDCLREKFSNAQMAALRNEVRDLGADSFQVAEIIKMYLAALGYGISTEAALEVAIRLEGNEDVGAFHELERFALPM